MRQPQECIRLFSGQILPQGGTYPIRTEFPVGGEIYNTIRLVFHNTITVNDSLNPVVRGGYNIVRNILFRSARGEEFIICPGMGLFYHNWMVNGVEPLYDNIAAADGVYTTIIDLPFSSKFLARREDLAVHTARYSHVELDLSLGQVADMFSTPGVAPATNVTTLDVVLFRNKSGFYESGEPMAAPYLKHYPQYLITRGYLDVESSRDLTMLGFMAFCQLMDVASCYVPVHGVPYSGVPQDSIDWLTFRDNKAYYIIEKPCASFREERGQYGTIDHADIAEGIGVYPYFFAREGSVYNGYWTGGKSEIRLENDPISLDPSGAEVLEPDIDTIFFGLRTLKD